MKRDRVPERRLVLAPVEQGLGDGGGAFQRQAGPPGPGPRRIGAGDGIERRKGGAGELERLGLRSLTRISVRPGPGGRAGVRRGAKRRESSPGRLADGGAFGYAPEPKAPHLSPGFHVR